MPKGKPFSTLNEQVLHENPYWTYQQESYLLADGISESDYYYVNSRGSTIIIPLLTDDVMIMIRQYRYLNQRFSIEFPGGGIMNGYSMMDNAHKELREETGCIARTISPIGEFNPCNGITNEICTVYIAKDLTQAEQDMDETEEIEILHVNMSEMTSLIRSGEIWDGMTLASWTLFQTVQSKDSAS